MGNCKYCGQSAGWFSSAHKECEEKHDQGLKDFAKVLSEYFSGHRTTSDILSVKRNIERTAFFNEEDVCNVSDAEIRRYAMSIRPPFTPQFMHVMDDYLNAIGVPFHKINKSGAIDEFTKKLMRGIMTDFFIDRLTLPVAHQRCEKVLSRFPMSSENIEDAYLYVLDKAATNFMKDGYINDVEQRKIDEYVGYLNLPVNNLPAKYNRGEISKLGQLTILKNLQNGVVPSSQFVCPIILSRGESIVWVYNSVTMYQEKTERQYQGRRNGWSFRVMKGVTYHTGGTNMKPIEHTYMENKGVGTLYVTNKNIIFQGSTAAIKVPYAKLIGVTPYSDGIEVHRDGANMKRLAFQGFDSWFLMNVISLIANM